MQRFAVGRARIPVTGLSLGSVGAIDPGAPRAEHSARRVVDAAWEAGIRAYAAAPHSDSALSEGRLGAALRHRPRDEYTLSTTLGCRGGSSAAAARPPQRPHWHLSGDGIRHSFAQSLRRLGTDRVDIVYLHWPAGATGRVPAEAITALERLRDQCRIGAIGIVVGPTLPPARVVCETDVDIVLLGSRLNLLDQSALEEFLPAAAERGVSVIADGLLGPAVLAERGAAAFGPRTLVTRSTLTRALRMRLICDQFGVPMRAAAIQYPFLHPGVAGVLIRAHTAAEVRAAVQQARHPIPGELWGKLRAVGLLSDPAPRIS